MGQLGASTMIGKTMSLSVALLSALLATAASIPAPRVGDCAAADGYIDEVLANVAKMVIEQGYDPAELPGDEVHFSQDIGFITIHGSARYDQGTLTDSQPSIGPGRPSSVLETPLMSMQT